MLESQRKSQKKLRDGDDTVTLLDPMTIPNGENNKVLSQIEFEIGQSDFKTSYLILSDATNKDRYSPPSDWIPKPRYQ